MRNRQIKRRPHGFASLAVLITVIILTTGFVESCVSGWLSGIVSVPEQRLDID